MTRRPLLTLTAAGMALPLVGPPARAQNELPAKPSPEMQKLGFLVGKRTATRRISPIAGAPYSATETWEGTWALGGHYLRFVQTNEPSVAAVRAHPPWHVGISGAYETRTPEGHLRVNTVTAGSPADKAGLKAGDVITGINGRPLAGISGEQEDRLENGSVGATVRVTVSRGDQVREISVVRKPFAVLRRLVWEPRTGHQYAVWGELEVGGRYEKMGPEMIFTASP